MRDSVGMDERQVGLADYAHSYSSCAGSLASVQGAGGAIQNSQAEA